MEFLLNVFLSFIASRKSSEYITEFCQEPVQLRLLIWPDGRLEAVLSLSGCFQIFAERKCVGQPGRE